MNKGTVKFYNDLRRYGVIKDLATQKDFHVYEDGLKESIKDNDEVTFELEEDNRGTHAVDVRQA